MLSKQETFDRHFAKLRALRFNVQGLEAPKPESMAHIHDLDLLLDIDMVVQQSARHESDPEIMQSGLDWVAHKHHLKTPANIKELSL